MKGEGSLREHRGDLRTGPVITSVKRQPTISRAMVPRGEILTFPDTLTTQGLSLWSLNIVGCHTHHAYHHIQSYPHTP